MYNRFKDSIISPKNLLEYRNDHLLWVFLYILFFTLLLSTRTIIDVITYDGLTETSKTAIAQDFMDLDPDCGINASSVYCDEEKTMLFYEDQIINFYVDSHQELMLDNYERQYNIVFQGDSLYFIFANQIMYQETLNNVPGTFTNIDFSLQQSDPDAFEDVIFSAVDDYMLSFKPLWGPMMILLDFLSGFILFMFFILFSAWMLKARFKIVKYRQFFTMTAYSSTGLYVILILNSLYNLDIFVVILLLIIAFRQNNQLSMEIIRRLDKKP